MEKRLEHIIDSMIMPHIKDKYPMWEELIKGYFQYLDNTFFEKIINLTNNNNAHEIYSELIDDYINTYFKGVINIEKYGLTDVNKRLYMSLSKFIAGLRGNKNGFDFIFRSLTDFRYPGENGDIDVDKIAVGYTEDESWWSTGHPYTYRFVLDQSYDVMKELIESVHPAGFIFEFITGFVFEDNPVINDEISMLSRRIPVYNAEFNYNGEITYGGIPGPVVTF